MHPFIETQKEWMRAIPPFRAGDTLRVNVRVKEGDKERLQAFEGVCIARRGSGVSDAGLVTRALTRADPRRSVATVILPSFPYWPTNQELQERVDGRR